MTERNKRILIGCSGSVASIKLESLIRSLRVVLKDVEVSVILTEHAQHFTPRENDSTNVRYYTDDDEWKVRYVGHAMAI